MSGPFDFNYRRVDISGHDFVLVDHRDEGAVQENRNVQPQPERQAPAQAGRQMIELPIGWKRQLDLLLREVAENSYDDLSPLELTARLRNSGISDADQAIILEAQGKVNETMAILDRMSCAQLVTALLNNDESVKVIDDAIEAQQSLGEKLRALKQNYPDYSGKLEMIADRCDRRVSEIMSAVSSLLVNPELDNMLKQAQLGSLPVDSQFLEQELKTSNLEEQACRQIMEKYNTVVRAMENLDGLNSAEFLHCFQNNGVQQGPNAAEEAMNALRDLSTALRELHVGGFDGPLEAIAMNCDMRLARIMDTGTAMLTVQSNQQRDERLDKSAKELIISLIPQMHGTDAVMSRLNSSLAPLLQKLDDFTSHPEAVKSLADIIELNSTMEKITRGISEIIEEGDIKLEDDSHFTPDVQLLSGLRRLLDKFADSFRSFQQGYLKAFHVENKQVKHLADQILTHFNEDTGKILQYNDFATKHLPCLTHIIDYTAKINSLASRPLSEHDAVMAELQEVNRSYAEHFDEIVTHCHEEMQKVGALLNGIYQIEHGQEPDKQNEMLSDFLALPEQDRNILAAAAKSIYFIDKFKLTDISQKTKYELNYQIKKLEDIFGKQSMQEILGQQYLAGANLKQALRKNIPLSTLVEAQLNGATSDMVDELCDDSNLADEPKILGSGAANSVKLCTYKNPSGEPVKKVFKAEYEASIGNLKVYLGYVGLPSLQVAKLNIASKKCAGLLNSDELLPKTSVGMLRGEYGMFMDFVPGYSGYDVQNAYHDVGNDDTLLSLTEIRNLSREHKVTVRGQVMRQLNKLQWNDLLTAQGDRHCNNYNIAIGKDMKVKLCGIDNDTCFFDWKIGLTKVRVSDFYLKRFREVLAYRKMDVDQFLSDMQAKGALTENRQEHLVFDTSKMTATEQDILQRALGIQSFNVPEYMDTDIYDGLMELEKDQSKLDANLPPDLPEPARAAAHARLKEMIEIAHKYMNEGRVYSEQDWQSEQNQERMYMDNMLKVMSDRNFNSDDTKVRLLSDLYFRDVADRFSL